MIEYIGVYPNFERKAMPKDVKKARARAQA
jgi:hypothetical protein